MLTGDTVLGVSGGIIGLIIFIVDIIIVFEVLNSNRTFSGKFVWVLLIFLFPVFGLIIYWLFSNRKEHVVQRYESIP